jgi:hypothetical protein
MYSRSPVRSMAAFIFCAAAESAASGVS